VRPEAAEHNRHSDLFWRDAVIEHRWRAQPSQSAVPVLPGPMERRGARGADSFSQLFQNARDVLFAESLVDRLHCIQIVAHS
jgi:hypothetical protein